VQDENSRLNVDKIIYTIKKSDMFVMVFVRFRDWWLVQWLLLRYFVAVIFAHYRIGDETILRASNASKHLPISNIIHES
jgi:hypothetical protein